MPGEVLVRCANLISPGLLNRCRLYHRTESGAPDKCFDGSAHPEHPSSILLACPNNTTARAPIAFTEEQLAAPYPVFGTPKSRAKSTWDHDGGSDEPLLEPETDEEPETREGS